MSTTFNTTHKDHALARAKQARSFAAEGWPRGDEITDTAVALVGSAIVHALLEVASAINDHARDTR